VTHILLQCVGCGHWAGSELNIGDLPSSVLVVTEVESESCCGRCCSLPGFVCGRENSSSVITSFHRADYHRNTGGGSGSGRCASGLNAAKNLAKGLGAGRVWPHACCCHIL
jgi:hypothetical protein